ncbi:EAL domain-containing protein [Paraconexibacter antarcticus]|uniref:EAL domain-containing protein n=1 Tax=Paraconexibacter antarcticus TaxID=2949664 RepID=A0ABY5DR00_9ACTN|nr:EAL domain-containing protein [Paraconexibacter antarcticus]UTI63880.1 EAL domain-containing protein [Paraconexibacter antarcticus]
MARVHRRRRDGQQVLFGATWDATALADAQAALRESEQAAPAGIAIVELDGSISRSNRALGELLGRGSEELAGMAFASLVHPDEDPPAVIAADHAVTRELRLLGADGEAVWATVSAAPVRGADGVPRHHVVHVQDARERKRFEGELQHLAEHDALTDLWNRRRFNEEVDRALADAQRSGTSGALLLFDLDGLKHINDTLGHAVGDQLLGAVADVLRGRLRATDTPARLGGDEFAVLLPRADEQAARTLAAGLLESIGAVSPLASSAGAGTITACAGIAVFGGSDDIVSGEQLLIEADVALYAAKDAGRGQLRLRHIGAEPGPATARRPRWSARIREALDSDRFVLHAQPIVALAGDGGGERAEILLRMRDDHGQLQAPTTFLPTAERSALIQEIDRWVVHAALADLGARGRAGEDLCRHVNLSARSVIDPGMGRYVCDELDASGVDGRRLVVEVTETSAIVNLERARDFVDAIRARGCRLALDDFGAGFTSFHYLKHLDFAYVKIDGAFIEGPDADPTNQSLVRALADMARSLGKKTVAECVQHEATVRWLRDLGVDYAQGFHLGRPAPL